MGPGLSGHVRAAVCTLAKFVKLISKDFLSFIFEANIAHYKKLLACETDTRKIDMIDKLLAEEEAKFADCQ